MEDEFTVLPKASPPLLHCTGEAAACVASLGLCVRGVPTLPALAGLTGPLSSLDSLVLDETCALTEGLPTLLTVVLPMYVVDSSVVKRTRMLTEGFPTLITFIGSFSSVNSLRLNETSALNKALPIHHICVILLLSGFPGALLSDPYVH